MNMFLASSARRTVEQVFKDYSARRAGIIRALTSDVNAFYSFCDPEKDNLCLYGYPDGSWKVVIPMEEVPPEIPEPALGINFARDGMERKDWITLVAVHSDSWLLSVAFFLAARFNANDRKRLFSMINDLPTVNEVLLQKKASNDKSGIDEGTTSRQSTKRSSAGEAEADLRSANTGYDEGDDEHSETHCGTCGDKYNSDESDEFWIGCDVCERWFHGKCVKITPAEAERIEQYECPSCSSSRKGKRVAL